MRNIVFILAFMPLMWSCNKTRTCECKNTNGIYTAGEVEGTKSSAKRYCKELSTANTECYLKN